VPSRSHDRREEQGQSGRGPVVAGYDGSPAAERAVGATARVATRRVLVVVVWEPGIAFELIEPPLVPAPIDVRAALELDEAVYESARRLAEQGVALARQKGLEAEGLAVADVLTVAETLLRLARERHAPAVVVGAHGHSGLGTAPRLSLDGSWCRGGARPTPPRRSAPGSRRDRLGDLLVDQALRRAEGVKPDGLHARPARTSSTTIAARWVFRTSRNFLVVSKRRPPTSIVSCSAL
jgi:nucleotide-binding universal stress UspA family protein